MPYDVMLTNEDAMEDAEVKEYFLDRGGWVDGNAMIATDVPDDLADALIEREWAELVLVDSLSDQEAARLAGVDVHFLADPQGDAEQVGDALDAEGREWSHFGEYGTETSQWLVVRPTPPGVELVP